MVVIAVGSKTISATVNPARARTRSTSMILNVKRIVQSILGRVMVIVTTKTTFVAATGMAAIVVDIVIKGISTVFVRSALA
jgi:hypothetical protein